jgi:hypothetical protein
VGWWGGERGQLNDIICDLLVVNNQIESNPVQTETMYYQQMGGNMLWNSITHVGFCCESYPSNLQIVRTFEQQDHLKYPTLFFELFVYVHNSVFWQAD